MPLKPRMPARAWFPTYVYAASLQGKRSAALAQLMLGECQNVREQDAAGRAWCQENYASGYTSYGTMRDLPRVLPTFRSLEQAIWPHVKRFAERLDIDLREANLAMTDCWVNIMSQGAAHAPHSHPGATVSGTFYVATPAGCSGIRFEDPRPHDSSLAPPRFRECRPENRRHVSYEATAGTLILFESWLRHEVVTNPTLDERVSISFNYTWV
jgi:uncharacterized protein (TIGR02466 family)